MEIVERLNTEINAVLAVSKFKARIADAGGTVLPGSPADFGRLIVDKTEQWAKVIKTANIKPRKPISAALYVVPSDFERRCTDPVRNACNAKLPAGCGFCADVNEPLT